MENKTVVPPIPRYAIGNQVRYFRVNLFTEVHFQLKGSFFKRPIFDTSRNSIVNGIIFGCPFDAGCSYRVGARFGPQGVRQASQLMQYSYHPWHKAEIKDKKVFDAGDVPCTPYNIKNALNSIYEYAAELRKYTDNVICVGGDHTISYSLLKAASEKIGKPVSLLHFDTHLDTGQDSL